MTFLFLSSAYGATYYMPDDYSTLRAAVAGMSSGDTLIIRNGVYSGSENVLDQRYMPPSGTDQARTIIRAENDGGAVFPDGFLKMTGPASVSYVDIIGLKSTNGATLSYNTSYWRFFRCGFTYSNASQSDDSTFGISGTYHLVEDCWVWGEGRYGMYATASDYTNHIVFRRCVVRMDKLNAYSPIAALHAYGVHQVAFQNCIVIDGDDNFWLNYEEKGPAYYTHNRAVDTIIDSCIAINYPSYFAGGTPGEGIIVKNSVAVDLDNGLVIDMKSADPDDFSVDHFTVWNTDSTGMEAKTIAYVNGTITNSIVYGNTSYGLRGYGLLSNYNVLYKNGTDYYNPSPGTQDYCADNSNAIDPSDGTPGNGTACMLYPVRIEDGSNCDGTGSSGSDRGATILKRVGISGTCWGESGWDSVTSDNLWPWPYEDRIKKDMASYSYTGVDRDGNANQTLSGDRGFCAEGKQLNGVDDITLTSYIWEYLGNPIPADIYSDSVTIPDVVNFVAIPGNNQVTLKWNNPTSGDFAGVMIRYRTDQYPENYQDGTFLYEQDGTADGSTSSFIHSEIDNDIRYYYSAFSRSSDGTYSHTAHASAIPTSTTDTTDTAESENSLQNFEDGILWQRGGQQDPTGNGRGWMVLYADSGSTTNGLEIDDIGANGTKKSLKVTINNSEDTNIYFLSPDKNTDYMPEAKGANRMSFYVRFPEGFPIQTEPYRYRTWQLGTYIHDPNDWNNDSLIRHFYHFLTMEQVGNGWTKYILTIRPDQERDAGTAVPDEMSYYYDELGRFYFQFGSAAGGPQPSSPYTIWIDEINFYYDDGTVGGQIHDGGQADSGFDGEFIADNDTGETGINAPENLRIVDN